MRLSKNNLILIWIIPVILGLIVIFNFWNALSSLDARGLTTHLIFYQVAIIGIAVFLGLVLYWSIVIYYIHLMQENEIKIQDNFTELAGSGTSHLSNARRLIGKVLENLKTNEDKMKTNNH
jgi:hypothetical protein